jgi:hypothetical protein
MPRKAPFLELTVVLPEDTGKQEEVGEVLVTALARLAMRLLLEQAAQPTGANCPDMPSND